MIKGAWRAFRKWWRVWRLPASVGLVLGVLWLVRAPLLARVSVWRAGGVAAAAAAHAERSEWREAETEARRAIQLDRSRFDALRVLMEAAFRNGRTDALRLATGVFLHPDCGPADQARALDMILAAGDHVGVRRLLASLSPERRSHPDLHLQETRFHSRRGSHDLALSRLESIPDGADPGLASLTRAEVQIGARRYREAQEDLRALLSPQPQGTSHKAALRLLHSVPVAELDPSLVGAVEQTVADLGGEATGQDRLLPYSLALAAAGDRLAEREPVLVRAIAAFVASEPESLGNWLFAVGEGERLRQVLPEDICLRSESLFFLRLRSLVAAEDWISAKAWLGRAAGGIDPVRLEITRAIVARRLGDSSEAVSRWRAAMHSASIQGGGAVHWKLGSLAMAHREWEWAYEAILKASQDPATILPPSDDLTVLVDALARLDRIDAAIDLTQVWAAREPESPRLVNNLLYLHLLSGSPLPRTLEESERLCEAFPGMTVFLGTRALALLLDGREAEATALLTDPRLDWSLATPTTRAVRARLESGPGTRPDFPDAAALYPAERRLLGFE